jgi:hypothetical protein
MSISTFKLYKKLSNELKFKYSELDYIEEACKEGNIEFEGYYRDFCERENISISNLESKEPEKIKQFGFAEPPSEEQSEIKEYTQTAEETRAKKIFQKIFRGIAKKVHPDKFSNMKKTIDIIEKEELFKKATYAFNNEKWGLLLEIAEELDIHPQKYEKINELLRDEISDVNKEIVAKQKSFGWHISQAETSEEKDNIVLSFLKTLFGYEHKK